MKRNQISGLKFLGFSLAISLLIFFCAATGLVSYLAFSSFGAVSGSANPESGPVRIRTLPELAPVAPAPVTNELDLDLAGVIEETDPEPVVEIEAPPVVAAPAPVGPVIEAETSADPSPVGPPAIAAEEERFAEAVEPDAAPAATGAGVQETTAPAEISEEPVPAEDAPAVEVPAGPPPSGRPLPEIVANPAPPPQVDPPAPDAPSEPTFVPDSSYFDQLLEQVD